jgi:hypothetical protein
LINSFGWFGFIFLNEILSVECRMSSSNLWIKDENLFWLWISVFVEVLSNFSGGSLVSSNWIGLSIERSMSSRLLWVKNKILLWLWISLFSKIPSDNFVHYLVHWKFIFFYFWISLSVESRMGSSNFWIKNENLLRLRVSIFVKCCSNFSSGFLIGSKSIWFLS